MSNTLIFEKINVGVGLPMSFCNSIDNMGGGFSYLEVFFDILSKYESLANDNISIYLICPCTKDKIPSTSPIWKWEDKLIFKEDDTESMLSTYTSYNISLMFIFRIAIFDHWVQKFPFCLINWDIGPNSTYYLPEFSESFLKQRQAVIQEIFPRALLIFAESNSGKKEIEQLLQINPQRIKIIPLCSGNVINTPPVAPQKNILDQLESYKYFIYPAQFWAHKNHINLLIAFLQLQEKQNNIKLVLTGSNQGNLKYIQNIIAMNNLEDKCIITGFISQNELSYLYQGAHALVFPSLFGTTNMPPLEAREFNCPVLCSDLEGHREMLGEGAHYFNPESPKEILDAMLHILNDKNRKSLLQFAEKQKQSSIFNQKSLEQYIKLAIQQAVSLRRLWTPLSSMISTEGDLKINILESHQVEINELKNNISILKDTISSVQYNIKQFRLFFIIPILIRKCMRFLMGKKK